MTRVDPRPSRPPSAAQDAARRRNWRLRNLRALHALAVQLTESRRAAVRALIDDEIELLGAEPEGKRQARLKAEAEAAADAAERAWEPKCRTCDDGFLCPPNVTTDACCPDCGGDVIPF